jgi:hypothetical protein
MENLLNQITGAAKSLPKKIVNTTTSAVKTVTQAPAAVTKVVRDSVSLGQSRPHQEIKRTQVLKASRGTIPQAKPTPERAPKPKLKQAPKRPVAPKAQKPKNGAAKPKVKSFSMNTDMIKEMSPAQQRAYFARAKERSGNSLTNLKADFDKPEAGAGLYSDEFIMNGLQESGSWVKDKVSFAYDYHTGGEGKKKAAVTARELEQTKHARFESRLQQQNPERYEQYKKSQEASDAQIEAEHTKEHWNKRDARLYEERRSSHLLAQDPSKLESRLSPEKLARYKKANANSMESIVEGTRPDNWDKTDAQVAQVNREKALVPQKEKWLKTLSPEQREKFQAREQSDRESIMDSAMEQHKELERAKDFVSLGSHTVSREDGLIAGTADLLTMGGVAASKNAGQELGKGLAYLEQAGNLENAGVLNDAHDYSERGTKLTASGTVNLAVAGGTGYGLIKSAHGQMMKRLKPPTTATATVSAKGGRNISHRMGGGSAVTGNKVASETAQTFDDMVQMSKNSGVEHTIDVNMVKYRRTSKIGGFKPKFEPIPSQHHITVHGGNKEFAEKIAGTMDNLPEATYQAVDKIDNIHVGNTKYYKDPSGNITDDMMGAVDLASDRATMVLNRHNIENSLRYVKPKDFKAAAQATADTNLRKTVWHELGHVHDKLLGNVSKSTKFANAESKSYSDYAAKSGDLSEEFAEGYANMLEARRDALKNHISEDDFLTKAIHDAKRGERNEIILEDVLYNDNKELNIFDPSRNTRLDILPEDYEFGIDAVY